jgi:type III pantothenate kinase
MKKRSNVKNNFLAIDVGNTSISFALLSPKKIVPQSIFSTETFSVTAKKGLYDAIRLAQKNGVGACIISSVVPSMTKILEESIIKRSGISCWLVGRDLQVPLKSHYCPREVGQDRLICAYAAKRLYGTPLIIIDLGTAITCDVVSAGGDYEGGIITPGLRLSLESLSLKTALLPRVGVDKPQRLIGRDTRTSILSGIFYGYGSLIDGLVGRICDKKFIDPRTILTGGHARMMKRYLKKPIYKINNHLIFDGLRLLAYRL